MSTHNDHSLQSNSISPVLRSTVLDACQTLAVEAWIAGHSAEAALSTCDTEQPGMFQAQRYDALRKAEDLLIEAFPDLDVEETRNLTGTSLIKLVCAIRAGLI